MLVSPPRASESTTTRTPTSAGRGAQPQRAELPVLQPGLRPPTDLHPRGKVAQSIDPDGPAATRRKEQVPRRVESGPDAWTPACAGPLACSGGPAPAFPTELGGSAQAPLFRFGSPGKSHEAHGVGPCPTRLRMAPNLPAFSRLAEGGRKKRTALARRRSRAGPRRDFAPRRDGWRKGRENTRRASRENEALPDAGPIAASSLHALS